MAKKTQNSGAKVTVNDKRTKANAPEKLINGIKQGRLGRRHHSGDKSDLAIVSPFFQHDSVPRPLASFVNQRHFLASL